MSSETTPVPHYEPMHLVWLSELLRSAGCGGPGEDVPSLVELG